MSSAVWKSQLNRILFRLLGWMPAAFYEAFSRKNRYVFYYHLVSAFNRKHTKCVVSCTPPDLFERDVVHLKKHFSLTAYPDAIGPAEKNNSATRRRSALITFDDGFAECFDVVRPILLKHSIPCIFFITTQTIDNRNMNYPNIYSLCASRYLELDKNSKDDFRSKMDSEFGAGIASVEELSGWYYGLRTDRAAAMTRCCELMGIDLRQYMAVESPYLSESQIRRLQADGFTIGAHGRTHSRLQSMTNAQMEEEIAESCRILSEKFNLKSVPFAFPFSGAGIDRAFLKGVLEKYEFIGGFFDVNGMEPDDKTVINRIPGDLPGAGTFFDKTPGIEARIKNAHILAVADRWKKRLKIGVFAGAGPSN